MLLTATYHFPELQVMLDRKMLLQLTAYVDMLDFEPLVSGSFQREDHAGH